MRPETGDASYLWDMLDAASAIREFVVSKNFNDYANDRLLRGAIERHVLAHEYGEVKHESIWRVATLHIPELIEKLEPLIPAPPSSSLTD